MGRTAAVIERYGDRLGERIGDLVFVDIAAERADGNRLCGIFRCDCGNTAQFHLSRVLNGKTRTHCGCKTDRGKSRTHGMHGTPEYSSWSSMKARCLDPGNKDYPRWGGRGITICAEWVESFEAFFAHIGPRPPGTSLDRIDTTRGYEPGNVRWATDREQAQNRATSYRWHIKGRDFESSMEAAQHFGVSDVTISRWVHGAFDNRRGTFTEPRNDCYVTPRY